MRDAPDDRPFTAPPLWPLWGLIGLCVVIETALSLADWGLIPVPRLRATVYEYAAFWAGLLRDWKVNYPGQPWVMFITYGFLHGGPMHLIVNMLTLFSLGRAVLERVGLWGFALLYAASLLGGALGFGLLADTLQPMVGASGALFGLVGGLLAWNYVDRFNGAYGLWPVARAIVILIAINLVLWWSMGGQLAWETHLGGFITGWLAAVLIDPRPQEA